MADGINNQNQNQGQGEGNQNQSHQNQGAAANNQNQGQAFSFDYDKLASIVSGAQTVKEEAVLKNYFKQQGLSQEEMTQAIAAFKQQKQANTPDVAAIQTQLEAARNAANEAQINSSLQMAAVKCDVDVKNISYVLKLADTSALTKDSKEEDFLAVINKVLEDIPALKKSGDGASGFQQVGAGGNSGSGTSQQDALKKIFGN